MKTLLIIFLFANIGFSQITNKCNLRTIDKATTLEKIVYTELAVVGYGVADYFLYNSMKNNVEQYRFIQGIMFAGINYLLYKYVSPSSSIGFSVQCLFATPDMVYYGMDKAFGHPNGFSNGNEFAINKSYAHLNFVPLAWGSDKAHGLDVVVSNIIGTAFSVIIQF